MREAQLHSVLLKQPPLSPPSCSHLFTSSSYPPGESGECHLSCGSVPPHPPLSTSHTLAAVWCDISVTLAFPSLRSANDICILLAGEMWAGTWGPVGRWGVCSPEGEADTLGAGHVGHGEAGKRGKGGSEGTVMGGTERCLSKEVLRTKSSSWSGAPSPGQHSQHSLLCCLPNIY